jgi:hypothetical protein
MSSPSSSSPPGSAADRNSAGSKVFFDLASSGGGVCPVGYGRGSAAAAAPSSTTTATTATSASASPPDASAPTRCSSESLERAAASPYPSAQFDPGFKGVGAAAQDPNWHYVHSTTIPSTEDAGNSNDGRWWVGPSANQLMRALQRKGKAEGVTQEDAKVVTAIHSVVTETTWAAIMEYEQMHAAYARCACIYLMSYRG